MVLLLEHELDLAILMGIVGVYFVGEVKQISFFPLSFAHYISA